MRPMKPCKFLIPVLLVFFVTCTSAPAQTYTILHTFTGVPKDGQWPLGILLRDAAGNLYGTTEDGGSGICGQFSCGTVFMLNKSGNEVGVFSFNEPDGNFPVAGLFRDSAGNLYGTTLGGGVHSCENDPPGCGTVFQLNKTGNKLRYYSFDGNNGFEPGSTPVILSGSLYGTTYEGGNQNFGTLYKINALGKETVLHKFNGGDGCGPSALIADPKGNLYGVTNVPSCGSGTLFEFDTAGNFTMLARIGGVVGAIPQSLIFDSQGNLYGTALEGGSNGDGTVFELSSQNGIWSGHALYSFCSLPLCVDGKSPRGQLVRDSAGNIYGVTYDGGAYDNGTIFKLDPSGNNETVLYSFTGGSDGANPFGGLIMDASGNLYGAAETGGDISCPGALQLGCGVVFELTP